MQHFRRYLLHLIGGCITGIWAANASLLLTGLRPNKDFDNFYPLLPALCFLLIIPVLTTMRARKQPLRWFTNWSCLIWLLPCGLIGCSLLPLMAMLNIGLQAS